jgi:hypothetical protein
MLAHLEGKSAVPATGLLAKSRAPPLAVSLEETRHANARLQWFSGLISF